MKILKELSKYKIWIFCIGFSIIMAIFSPVFLTVNNISGILVSMYPYGTVAIGLMFGLIAGVNNLTIGSIACLSAVLFAMNTQRFGLAAGILIALGASLLIGLMNGVMCTYLKMDGWLVAIALMIGVRGFANALIAGATVRIESPLFTKVSTMRLFGLVPVFFILLVVVALIVDFVLKYTSFGRRMYAVGGNAAVTKACGINVNLTKVIAVAVSSLLAGMGGILITSRLGSANGSLGMDAIMACLPMVIIGGAAFNGGKGSAVGALSGCLVMTLITTFMNLFNVYIDAQNIVQGMIVLFVIVADKYFANKEIKV